MAEDIYIFHYIQSRADTTFICKYDGHTWEDMTTPPHEWFFTHDDEGVDEKRWNDIEYSRMLPIKMNEDFTVVGTPELHNQSIQIFSFKVNSKAMLVPPMEFSVDAI